jgi:hypothetical protein
MMVTASLTGLLPRAGRGQPTHARLASVTYVTAKAIKDDEAFFTIRWSPIARADKYTIINAVPAMSGLAELYYMDGYGKLNIYMLARSDYSGLRATLRVATDPDLERDQRRRQILLDHEDSIYYRYTLLESRADMCDLVHFFMNRLCPTSAANPPSGRYRGIYINELDTGKLVTI